MLLRCLVLASFVATARCRCTGEWADVDTPDEACSSPSHRDGAAMQLVFSDEFDRDNRTFHDGSDTRWTALDGLVYTNAQINAYDSDLAVTGGGMLQLRSSTEDFVFEGETRHLRTPMLQSWNKFCFRSGAAEVSVQLPGDADQPGLWPAFWLMGNLGRATFAASTDGLWPFVFDECVSSSDETACNASQCYAQRISACNGAPGHGMNPYQGRGAPEIDVIEVQPGTYVGSYDAAHAAANGCEAPDDATTRALAMQQPFVSTSLQAAPGMPAFAAERPYESCAPTAAQWYPELTMTSYGSAQSTAYQVAANFEFWGDSFDEYWGSPPAMQTDALSANTALNASHFSSQHVYRVEWRAGSGGYMRWSLDGELQFEISAEVMSTPRNLTRASDGTAAGTMAPRQMPTEPMYLLLNVDSSPRWGWPSCDEDNCACCHDCKDAACTTCYTWDAVTNTTVNERQWLAELCEMVNATGGAPYDVDWVRVYQFEDERDEEVGSTCDPASHPTRVWIADHAETFLAPGADAPLLAVSPGGGACEADADCHAPHGTCGADGACVCVDASWTGPRCLAQEAGASARCRALEDAVLDADADLSGFAAGWGSGEVWPSPASAVARCGAPAAYDHTQLRALVAAACADAVSGSATAAVCERVLSANFSVFNSSQGVDTFGYVECSTRAHAGLVLQAQRADSGGLACCDMLLQGNHSDGNHSGNHSVEADRQVCRRGPAVPWLLAPVLLLLPALLLAWRRRPRRTWTPVAARAAVDSRAKPAQPLGLMRHQHAAQRQARQDVVGKLARQLGCQEDSWRNQAEHLESLLLSHLSTCEGDLPLAIQSLHRSLLEPWRRWKSQLATGAAGVDTRSAASVQVHTLGGESLWAHPPAEQLLREVTVWLLVWGEAGNLRFMPELLCFVFELARAHVDDATTGQAQGDAPAAADAPPGSLLNRIVVPIYNEVFRQTFAKVVKGRPQPLPADQLAPYPKNYDDFNEAFWSSRALLRLRTENEPWWPSGRAIMQLPPRERWHSLLYADWATFFGAEAAKTFRELRWWWCILASARRLLLLHALAFALCALPALPSSSLHGWGSLAVLPWVMLLAPLSSVGGAAFELWAHNDVAEVKDANKKSLLNQSVAAALLAVAAAGVAATQCSFSFEEWARQTDSFSSARVVVIGGFGLVSVAGAVWLKAELLPQTAPPGAFDAYLRFETTTARLPRQSWLVRGSWCTLRPQVRAVLGMYTFWGTVWACKAAFTAGALLPALLDAQETMLAIFDASRLAHTHHPWLSDVDLALDPLQLLRGLLTAMLWAVGFGSFVADTLLWYQVVLGAYGGVVGLLRYGARGGMPRAFKLPLAGLRRVSPSGDDRSAADAGATLRSWAPLWSAILDDLHDGDLISTEERAQLAAEWDPSGMLVGSTPSMTLPAGKEARRRLQFLQRSLRDPRLPQSRGVLQAPGLTILIPHYAETILVPFGELKTKQQADGDQPPADDEAAVAGDDAATGSGDSEKRNSRSSQIFGSLVQRLESQIDAAAHRLEEKLDDSSARHEHVMGFLVHYYPDEWRRFAARCAGAGSHGRSGGVGGAAQGGSRQLMVRKWASLRLQTLYRTVAGMMKHRTALDLLLRCQHPEMADDAAELNETLDAKFRCVAALQRYAVMSPSELEDVELLLAEFPSLVIAYIEEEKTPPPAAAASMSNEDLFSGLAGRSGGSSESASSEALAAAEAAALNGGSTFYSCMVDADCARVGATGRRAPRFRIMLPGHPILGNGKSDNQNCAIVFSRGAIIQAIDANQEGYLEEALKLPCLLREFEPTDDDGEARHPPAIVGFREHIFSGLGALGDFAAGSELCFGTLVQRSMAETLQSRYHYGHPDLLDKCKMMAQGGISKATRGLNLSEDIFAGMDAMLRGQTVVHREYCQVGKGRDMGFLSILGFFCKLSSGTAQMSTSRQAYRLGQRLGLARLMGYYYGHTGFYVGQLHFYHATYGLLALAYLGALLDGTGLLEGAAAPAAAPLNLVFGPLFGLFFAASLLPLAMATLVEHGVAQAILTPLKHIVSGSPLFFLVQSRCIGHYISGEFAAGGAAYIPTGRGLAIARQPFHSVYAAFAPSCSYAGAELAALLALAWLVAPSSSGGSQLALSAVCASALTPLALLYGPALFNPRCFALQLQARDLRAWLGWLMGGGSGGGGWAAYHEATVAKKRDVAAHALLLPSKELLLAPPTLLIAHLAMHEATAMASIEGDAAWSGAGWSAWQTCVLAVPALPAAMVAVLLMARRLLCHVARPAAAAPRRPASMAAVMALPCALLLAAEAVAVHAVAGPSLGAAQWAALLTARYFSWRFAANTVAYALTAAPPAGGGSCAWITAAASEVAACTAAAHAWLADFVLGLCLQLPVALLSLLPMTSSLHLLCLFYTTGSDLDASTSLSSTDQATMAAQEVQNKGRRTGMKLRAAFAMTARDPAQAGAPHAAPETPDSRLAARHATHKHAKRSESRKKKRPPTLNEIASKGAQALGVLNALGVLEEISDAPRSSATAEAPPSLRGQALHASSTQPHGSDHELETLPGAGLLPVPEVGGEPADSALRA